MVRAVPKCHYYLYAHVFNASPAAHFIAIINSRQVPWEFVELQDCFPGGNLGLSFRVFRNYATLFFVFLLNSLLAEL